MKKIFKIFVLILLLFLPTKALAKEDGKTLTNSVVVLGESLTEDQRTMTKELLGAGEGTKELTVMIKELNGLLQDDYPYNQVYSSVYIEPNKGEGIKVEIVTKNTITSKTAEQYERAAKIAGAKDVTIKIASVTPVDGSGALAGLYKAYIEEGKALSGDDIKKAQSDLAGETVEEEEKEIKGFDELNLMNPTFTYGTDLSKKQVAQSKSLLGLTEEYEKYLKNYSVSIEDMNNLSNTKSKYYKSYTALFIEPNNFEGLKVSISTPKTIQRNTELQFLNGARTAGVNNININIASVKAVDGSSALMGVYKAYQEEGKTLDPKRIDLAQKEIEQISDIVSQHENKKNFSDENLFNLIMDIKIEIDKGSEININQAVTDKLSEYNLKDILTPKNKKDITSILYEYETLPDVPSANYVQVEKKEEKKQANDVNWEENTEENTEEKVEEVKKESIIDKIVKFFKNIFN